MHIRFMILIKAGHIIMITEKQKKRFWIQNIVFWWRLSLSIETEVHSLHVIKRMMRSNINVQSMDEVQHPKNTLKSFETIETSPFFCQQGTADPKYFYVSMSTTRHRYYSLQPINPLIPLSLVVTYLWGSFWPVVLFLSEQGSGRRLWMFYRVACRSQTVIKCSWESGSRITMAQKNGLWILLLSLCKSFPL